MSQYSCKNCKINILTPIHYPGEDLPPLHCSQCDPSTRFTRYNWDGRTWRCIITPDDCKTQEIKDYLLSCGVRCTSLPRSRLLEIIKDVDQNVMNINKYLSKEKRIHNVIKINIDGDTFIVPKD